MMKLALVALLVVAFAVWWMIDRRRSRGRSGR
jgi:hypothetical protein